MEAILKITRKGWIYVNRLEPQPGLEGSLKKIGWFQVENKKISKF
jgi:hypothetical protein